MVDADVEIAGVIEKGKLLTLTTTEALQQGFADFRADTLEAVLSELHLEGADIRRATQTWAESLVRFLTHPVVSSLLMTVGVLGIIVEIRTPGFGVPGLLGLASFALFFWGHWLVRLAGWEELLLVGLGLGLVLIELLVIPGFGITGVLGLAALLAGFGLSLVGVGATWAVVVQALGQVAVSLLLAVLVSLAVLRVLPRLPVGRRLILDTELPVEGGYGSAPESDRRWVGKRGTAASPLRPAGLAHFDGERVVTSSSLDLPSKCCASMAIASSCAARSGRRRKEASDGTRGRRVRCRGVVAAGALGAGISPLPGPDPALGGGMGAGS
jgi:membrane-bound serine protease (ClpP class)